MSEPKAQLYVELNITSSQGLHVARGEFLDSETGIEGMENQENSIPKKAHLYTLRMTNRHLAELQWI